MSYYGFAEYNNKPPFFHNLGDSYYDQGVGVPPLNKHNATIQDVYRTPFMLTSDDNRKNNRHMFSTALQGIQADSDLSNMFFSDKNHKRIQKMIRDEVYVRTKGKFKLDVDQDTASIFLVMRAVYMEYGRYLPGKITEQVMKLNNKVVWEVVPGMITELRQYYGYLKDINSPRELNPLPINVNNAGRNTLPSYTTLWS